MNLRKRFLEEELKRQKLMEETFKDNTIKRVIFESNKSSGKVIKKHLIESIVKDVSPVKTEVTINLSNKFSFVKKGVLG
jgi:hypothetical protein